MLGCACLTKNCCRRHTQGGQQFGWVCTKAELLICMPWAFPGSCTKSGNTSAWDSGFIYALCHPTVVFPALLLYFLNFSVISASPFSVFWEGKAFTYSCTPPAPSVFFGVTDSQRQPRSQLREAHVSWLPSGLSAEPLPISFHQEGMALISRNQTIFHISNWQVWFGKEAIQ